LTTIDKNGVEKKMSVFLKKMSNYFSFGVDARIGYGNNYFTMPNFKGFDKSRTQSRFKNKVVYCWEGFKKMFTKTPKVNDVVDHVEKVKSSDPTEDV
jgi:diacylglycerol kinase (ATP)